MNSRYFYVVGNQFRAFADGKNILTLEQLNALFMLPTTLLDTHNTLLLGQGVHEDNIKAIVEHQENNPDYEKHFEMSDLKRISDRAARHHSHKKIPHNTLIGVPSRLSEKEFVTNLNIDERCELMGDHQTGKHVQGMLIIEAFRQTFLVVTETYYPLADDVDTFFVIDGMSQSFNHFLFPLPATIRYTVDAAEINKRRSRYSAHMTLIQNDVICASSDVSFSVYPADVITAKEAKLAATVTQELIGAHKADSTSSQQSYVA